MRQVSLVRKEREKQLKILYFRGNRQRIMWKKGYSNIKDIKDML